MERGGKRLPLREHHHLHPDRSPLGQESRSGRDPG